MQSTSIGNRMENNILGGLDNSGLQQSCMYNINIHTVFLNKFVQNFHRSSSQHILAFLPTFR